MNILRIVLLVSSLLLTACGGGDDEDEPTINLRCSNGPAQSIPGGQTNQPAFLPCR